MSTEERREYLFKKLYEKKDMYNVVLENICLLGSMSDEELLRYSNNVRLANYNHPCGEEYISRLTFDSTAEYGAELIELFAFNGDPLAEKIVAYCKSSPEAFRAIFMPCKTDIPAKLLSRQMTEKKYFGYLNGELPIVTIGGKKIYLPEDEQKTEVK